MGRAIVADTSARTELLRRTGSGVDQALRRALRDRRVLHADRGVDVLERHTRLEVVSPDAV